MPIPPLPENRSINLLPGMNGLKMLKRVSLFLSVVGLISLPGNVFNFRDLADPAITLIIYLLLCEG